MTDRIVPPRSHITFQYRAPPSGIVKIEIHSSARVHSYVMDEDGMADFQRSMPSMDTIGGKLNRMHHYLTVAVPRDEAFYVVIYNPKAEPVHVSFSIASARR